jgi:hypothetical protein
MTALALALVSSGDHLCARQGGGASAGSKGNGKGHQARRPAARRASYLVRPKMAVFGSVGQMVSSAGVSRRRHDVINQRDAGVSRNVRH